MVVAMVNKLSSKYSFSYEDSGSDENYSSLNSVISSSPDPNFFYANMDEKPQLEENEEKNLPNDLSTLDVNEFYPSGFPNGPFSPNIPRWKNNHQTSGSKEYTRHDFSKQSGDFYNKGNSHSSCVMVIGLVGMALGVSGLFAYGLIQIPSLRERLYKYPSYFEGSAELESRAIKGILTPGQVAYGFELMSVLSVIIIGIIANILLMYGVSKKSFPFVMPWMVFQAFFIVLLFLAFILSAIFVSPIRMKAFSVIPLVFAVIATLCWIKVFQFYKSLRRAKRERIFSALSSVADVEEFKSWFSSHSLPKRLQQWESSESTYKSFSNEKEDI